MKDEDKASFEDKEEARDIEDKNSDLEETTEMVRLDDS